MNLFGARAVERANELKFSASGIVDILPVLEHPLYQEHLSFYEDWINTKKHGEMGYLERGLERRKDPRNLMKSAQSLLAVSIAYPRNIPDDGVSPRYARYLYGPDYHDWMKEKLEALVVSLKEIFPSLEAKVCVDTSALLERTWAQFSGLGWIGKNTLLIHPKLGSYLFLGFILFSEKSEGAPNLLPNYCGNCTRCLEQCPTKALEKPGVLNSNQCIAYLTLEKRGPHSEEVKNLPFKRFIAGCDLCQEACPYNLKPAKNEVDDEALLQESQHCLTDTSSLIREDETAYKERVKGTALSRVKFPDAKRNLELYLEQSTRSPPRTQTHKS
jgi:epoxyqueuosine reductase